MKDAWSDPDALFYSDYKTGGKKFLIFLLVSHTISQNYYSYTQTIVFHL